MGFFSVPSGAQALPSGAEVPPGRSRAGGRDSRAGLFRNVSMGESEADKSCLLRIAPIHRDLRDIVDFVDLSFFEPQRRLSAPACACPHADRCSHRQAKNTKYILYVRRVKRRTYIVSPKGQSLLCVPCGFVVYCKQRGILIVARFFKVLMLYLNS